MDRVRLTILYPEGRPHCWLGSFMHPRAQILDLFSTFAQLEGDRFQQWRTDPRLRRNMQRCLAPAPNAAEFVWVLYWYQHWQQQPSALTTAHLTAYLQEVCYWVAHQISRRCQTPHYTLSDYFQIANGEIQRVLQKFCPDRGSSLKAYATMVLMNGLKDHLRQRRVVDICTDWSLLRQISKKRVGVVLEQAGLGAPEVSQYRLAWFCFQTLYLPTQAQATEQLAKPEGQLWAAIADLYNTQRQSLSVPGMTLTPAQIEARLTKLAQWIRAYLYPAIDSLNQKKAGEESGEFQDDLTDAVSPSLLDAAIQAEDRAHRTGLHAQLNTVLDQGLDQLGPESQEILHLFYQQGLSQQKLASQLQISQATVSRRLKKAEENLLAALIAWSQSQLNRFPNPDELKNISLLVREWLESHYCNDRVNSTF
jgi:RNA polymerase sigma factor (sigma-70 family)